MELFGLMFIFGGLLFVSSSIDKVARQMKRANDLRAIQLKSAGVSVTEE